MAEELTNKNDQTPSPLGKAGMGLNKYSKTLTQDQTQPAAQAMLYGIGLTDDDLKKAQVGIASMDVGYLVHRTTQGCRHASWDACE